MQGIEWTWFADNLMDNLWTASNTFLIFISITIGYFSYRYQARAGVREAMEQLEDVQLYRSKISPILHEFRLFPPKSVIQLKYYQFGRNPASANHPRNLLNKEKPWDANDDQQYSKSDAFQALADWFESKKDVQSASVKDEGIFIHIKSADTVKVKTITEALLVEFSDKFHRKHHQFADRFDMEISEYGQSSD